jgi:predicted DNA-binding transcriptional regulator AlpA
VFSIANITLISMPKTVIASNTLGQPGNGGEDILNDRQVSKILGVQPRALRRWRQELGLPYVKLTPKVVRYRRKDIYAWLEKQVVATVA